MSLLQEEATSSAGYEWMSVIGTGAYGTVYKARDPTGQTVAIKKIRIPSTEEGMPMSMIREVSMLRQLENYEHDNIVRLKDVFTAMKPDGELRLMLVLEYVEQDLAQYLERCPSPGLSQHTVRSLMQQLLSGVDFLHTLRIVHRDIKPQNVLVTSQGQVKLADFGLSRVYAFSMVLTSVVVTLWYRSPEVLLQDTYCTAVDLWSCGCIFAELFNRRPLFSGQSEVDQLCKIFELRGLPPESEWPLNSSIPRNSFSPSYRAQPWNKLVPEIEPVAADLIQSLLTFNQHKRICARDALRHPYFLEEEEPSDAAMTVTQQARGAAAMMPPVSGSVVRQLEHQLSSTSTHVQQPHVQQVQQHVGMSSQPQGATHLMQGNVQSSNTIQQNVNIVTSQQCVNANYYATNTCYTAVSGSRNEPQITMTTVPLASSVVMTSQSDATSQQSEVTMSSQSSSQESSAQQSSMSYESSLDRASSWDNFEDEDVN